MPSGTNRWAVAAGIVPAPSMCAGLRLGKRNRRSSTASQSWTCAIVGRASPSSDQTLRTFCIAPTNQRCCSPPPLHRLVAPRRRTRTHRRGATQPDRITPPSVFDARGRFDDVSAARPKSSKRSTCPIFRRKALIYQAFSERTATTARQTSIFTSSLEMAVFVRTKTAAFMPVGEIAPTLNAELRPRDRRSRSAANSATPWPSTATGSVRNSRTGGCSRGFSSTPWRGY